jgi:hypothetical protein
MRAMRLRAAMGVVVGVGVVAGLSGAASGGVIYDNGGVPDVAAGTTWYFAQSPGNGFVSTEFADDFVLEEGASTIRDIHWYGDVFGFNLVDELDSFTVTIYATAVGALAPGAVVTVAQITSIDRQDVVLANTSDTYLYSARVEDIVLEPGVRYWLGISGDSGSADAPWGWRSTDAGNGVRGWSRSGATGQFEPIGTDFAVGETAFYLTDDVPAPGGVALAGVMGMIGARRKRRA